MKAFRPLIQSVAPDETDAYQCEHQKTLVISESEAIQMTTAGEVNAVIHSWPI